MCTQFMALCCPERGNPREFLELWQMKKEELVQVGVEIEEKDYLSVIILFLALSNFSSAQFTAAQFNNNVISPLDLLLMLIKESACQRV